MHILIPILFLLVVLLGPQYWAKSILKRYSVDREDIPGTGGELAKLLIDYLEMPEVKLEATNGGDHYDPSTKTVRLTQANLEGKSLTAIATAAHEVGHAVQDHMGYVPLAMRTRLVGMAHTVERVGSLIVLGAPLLTVVSRAPAVGFITLLGGFAALGGPALIHLITFPVEWNASFGKALPILEHGKYINEADQKIVRRILLACSLTYLANSLSSILSFWRWLRVLRR